MLSVMASCRLATDMSYNVTFTEKEEEKSWHMKSHKATLTDDEFHGMKTCQRTSRTCHSTSQRSMAKDRQHGYRVYHVMVILQAATGMIVGFSLFTNLILWKNKELKAVLDKGEISFNL